MDNRQIPGFYYDAVKNRHFRISRHHQAPEGTVYTREALAKANAKDAADKHVAKKAKLSTMQKVQRSSTMQDLTLSTFTLTRESGAWQSPASRNIAETKAYASGFEKTWQLDVTKKARLYLDRDRLHSVWDRATSGFIVSGVADEGPDVIGCVPKHLNKFMSHAHPFFQAAHVSSLSMSPGRIVAMTSRDALHFFELADPSFSAPGSPPDLARSTIYSYRVQDLFCSSAQPLPPSSSAFAVGMNERVELFNEANHWNRIDSVVIPSDAFSIDWQSPTVCYIGQRNGQIHLWDVRSRDSVARLQHSSPATHVCAIKGPGLVVNGQYGQTAMYDLRMTSETPQSTTDTNGVWNHSKAVIKYLLPYSPLSSFGCFDVDKERSLMAVSNNDGPVDIYSLYSEKPIKRLSFNCTMGDIRFYDTGECHGVSVFRPDGLVGFEWMGESELE